MAENRGVREEPVGSGEQPTGPAVIWVLAAVVLALLAVGLFFIR